MSIKGCKLAFLKQANTHLKSVWINHQCLLRFYSVTAYIGNPETYWQVHQIRNIRHQCLLWLPPIHNFICEPNTHSCRQPNNFKIADKDKHTDVLEKRATVVFSGNHSIEASVMVTGTTDFGQWEKQRMLSGLLSWTCICATNTKTAIIYFAYFSNSKPSSPYSHGPWEAGSGWICKGYRDNKGLVSLLQYTKVWITWLCTKKRRGVRDAKN